jgi:hypothetical protein
MRPQKPVCTVPQDARVRPPLILASSFFKTMSTADLHSASPRGRAWIFGQSWTEREGAFIVWRGGPGCPRKKDIGAFDHTNIIP